MFEKLLLDVVFEFIEFIVGKKPSKWYKLSNILGSTHSGFKPNDLCVNHLFLRTQSLLVHLRQIIHRSLYCFI